MTPMAVLNHGVALEDNPEGEAVLFENTDSKVVSSRRDCSDTQEVRSRDHALSNERFVRSSIFEQGNLRADAIETPNCKSDLTTFANARVNNDKRDTYDYAPLTPA